jgi:indole-3-glycerol phosphate synthase
LITSLAQILNAKRKRLFHLYDRSLEELREEALEGRKNALNHLLRKAIAQQDRLNVIAEIKRASPWQDISQTEIDPTKLALAYGKGGAAAISVWTEEDHFHGSLDDLRAVRVAMPLPLLRKDIIVEPSQVYETAIAGVDALLLIGAVLGKERLTLLRKIAEDELGLDALVEVQNSNEMLWAYASGATLIGVNNRDPHTHEVSLDVSVEVARAAPKDILLVSENGLRTRKQLRGLRALGYSGFLIGEALRRGRSPDITLKELLQSKETGSATNVKLKD